MLGTEQLEPMRCPSCRAGDLHPDGTGDGSLVCGACAVRYAHADGITDLVPSRTAVGAGSAEDAAQAHYWEEEEEIYRPWDHVVARGFVRQRAAYIRQEVPLEEVSTAVDVGSGNGMSTHCLENDIETIYSLDFSRHLLLANPAKIRLRGDAYHLPFKDKSVDLVYSWELLHHVDEPSTVLVEMKRIARKYVTFFEPNRYNPAQVVFATLSKPNRSCLRNTRPFFCREIEKAGLEVVKHQTVGWLTPNVPPVWLYHILKSMPFRMPLIGLSHFFLLRCP